MEWPEDIIQRIIFVMILVVFHYFSHHAFKARKKLEPHLASISGGFAVAYVCLELFPELDAFHAYIGQRIYFFILFGFCLFYGMENFFIKHAQKNPELKDPLSSRGVFAIFYNLLLVFTIGHHLPNNLLLTIFFSLCLGLHLLSYDISLREHIGERFSRVGRFLMIFAVLFGFVLGLIREPDPKVVDVISATVSGFFLFNVFKEELPDINKANYALFLTGVLFFTFIHFIFA